MVAVDKVSVSCTCAAAGDQLPAPRVAFCSNWKVVQGRAQVTIRLVPSRRTLRLGWRSSTTSSASALLVEPSELATLTLYGPLADWERLLRVRVALVAFKTSVEFERH